MNLCPKEMIVANREHNEGCWWCPNPLIMWDNNATSTCLYPFLLTLAARGKTGIKDKVQSGRRAKSWRGIGTSASASLQTRYC